MASADFTEKELLNETWKPCPGFEKYYSVSDLGRVRRDAPSGHGGTQVGHIMKQSIASRYLCVTLCVNSKYTSCLVHRLVCRAFHGDPPNPKDETNHIDGDKMNNRANNLEWMTRTENIRHSYTIGTHGRGERHYRAKFTHADVLNIRQRLANGEKCVHLAKEFGVSFGAISKIKLRTRFKNV